MTISIFNSLGLIVYHQNNVNRVTCTSSKGLVIYFNWDAKKLQYETKDFSAESYSWFEIGDK